MTSIFVRQAFMVFLGFQLLSSGGSCALAADKGTSIYRPFPEQKRIADSELEESKRQLAQAEAALHQGEKAKSLASQYNDNEALKVSNLAIARANLAVELARKRVVEKEQAVRQITGASRVVGEMNALATRLKWDDKKRARLDRVLNSLDLTDDFSPTSDQIYQVWQDMQAHAQDTQLISEARHSKGTDLASAGSGQQTNYNDCAVFALANAAGLPYGVVAANATALISQGAWRDANDRALPQKAIERAGLNGGEVVMLAEMLGQAEAIPRSEFGRILAEGHPILIGVWPKGARGGHEVVLSKTFQHDGKTWYEMIDSNQGPLSRLYLSDSDLKTIMKENGVVLHSEAGSTPEALR